MGMDSQTMGLPQKGPELRSRQEKEHGLVESIYYLEAM
jgi:hypothetical protein